MNEYIWLYMGGVMVSSASQILLKLSANKHQEKGIREYANPYVVAAYSMLLLSLFISSQAIRHFQASIAPVIESTSYIFILILGRAFFSEKITLKKMVGVALVILGIVIFNIRL